MPIVTILNLEETKERIHSGLARAKEQGTKSGRPIGRPEVFTEAGDRVIALRDQGLGTRRIAKELKVCRATVIKALRAADAA